MQFKVLQHRADLAWCAENFLGLEQPASVLRATPEKPGNDDAIGRELSDRLLRSGFAQVRLYGDLSGAPFGVDAERLVAVATV